jgi:DNA-directed RNA polymerase subunit RPC12/RpoP
MPPKLTVDSINKIIKLDGYKCTSYNITNKKFGYICSNGHNNSVRMDHWNKGVRCPQCIGNKKLTLVNVKDSVENEGYKLLSDEYTNSKTKLDLVCPNDHDYKVSWNNWSTGFRCSKCSGRNKKL